MDAIDKTKGIAVCTLILGVIDDVTPCKMSKDMESQLTKVKRWSLECFDELWAGRKVSQWTMKDIKRMSREMFAERVHMVGATVTPESVVQELIASDGMLHWFCTKHGLKCTKWRYLKQTVDTLTRRFVEMFPEHEDCELYFKFDEVVNI